VQALSERRENGDNKPAAVNGRLEARFNSPLMAAQNADHSPVEGVVRIGYRRAQSASGLPARGAPQPRHRTNHRTSRLWRYGPATQPLIGTHRDPSCTPAHRADHWSPVGGADTGPCCNDRLATAARLGTGDSRTGSSRARQVQAYELGCRLSRRHCDWTGHTLVSSAVAALLMRPTAGSKHIEVTHGRFAIRIR
jgi:hypothetical protein